MSEQNTLLIEQVGKLLGDSLGGKLAQSVADLLRLERQNSERAERERIIKLLEEHTMRMTNPMDNTVVEGLRITPSELIALIKGENKTNFEVYLEEQLKNPKVRAAFEQEENR